MRIIPTFAVFVLGILAGLVYLSYGAAKPDGEASAEPGSVAASVPQIKEPRESVVDADAPSAAMPSVPNADPAADGDIPDEVHATIRAKAAEDHPDNYSTQVFRIKNELTAYRELQNFDRPSDIPEQVFHMVTRKAAEDHPDNYSTQVFLIKNELKAYRELQNFDRPSNVPQQVFRTVTRKAAKDHPDNYSTQLFLIRNELKAYRKLEGHKKQDASRQTTLVGEGSRVPETPWDTLTAKDLDENKCRQCLASVADHLRKFQAQPSDPVIDELLRSEPSEHNNRELARLLARHLHQEAEDGTWSPLKGLSLTQLYELDHQQLTLFLQRHVYLQLKAIVKKYEELRTKQFEGHIAALRSLASASRHIARFSLAPDQKVVANATGLVSSRSLPEGQVAKGLAKIVKDADESLKEAAELEEQADRIQALKAEAERLDVDPNATRQERRQAWTRAYETAFPNLPREKWILPPR
ncbi:MAG: hypothetical protein ACYTG0_37355 [Planctomycetota bacterium]|jgi:hypothetical protein